MQISMLCLFFNLKWSEIAKNRHKHRYLFEEMSLIYLRFSLVTFHDLTLTLALLRMTLHSCCNMPGGIWVLWPSLDPVMTLNDPSWRSDVKKNLPVLPLTSSKNYRGWRGCFSYNPFECRVACLATTHGSWGSRRGGGGSRLSGSHE